MSFLLKNINVRKEFSNRKVRQCEERILKLDVQKQ
jgi:hypothetical protein